MPFVFCTALPFYHYCTKQIEKAATAYFASRQLLPFRFYTRIQALIVTCFERHFYMRSQADNTGGRR